MDPSFPALEDGFQGSINYTTDFVIGSETVTRGVRRNAYTFYFAKISLTLLNGNNSKTLFLQSDYVAFTCPLGYAFEDSANVTHYAFCYNTTFVHEFDLEKRCLRKLYI